MSIQSNVYENPNRAGNKKWIGQLELPPVFVDGKKKRRRVSVYGATADEATLALREAERKHMTGKAVDPNQLLMADLFEMWLQEKINRRIDPIKPTTVNSYREWIARLNARFGGLRALDLTEEMVEETFRFFSKEAGLSEGFQVSLFFVLRDALAFGMRKKKLAGNVTDDVERPRPNKEEMKFLTEEEVRRMLEEAGSSRFYGLIHLAVSTGLRMGELLGLQWSDIRNDEIHVIHTLNTYKDKILFNPCRHCQVVDGRGTVKSKAGRRSVPLTAESKEVLRRQKERLMSEGLAASPWVFPSLAGTPIVPSNLRVAFKRALKDAQVKEVRFHDLRHTFASIMFDKGFSLLEIQRWLGHSDGEMTKRYAHLFETSRKKSVERLNGVFPVAM